MENVAKKPKVEPLEDEWKWSIEKLKAFYIPPGEDTQIGEYPSPPDEFITFMKERLLKEYEEGLGIPYFGVYGNVPHYYAWNMKNMVERIGSETDSEFGECTEDDEFDPKLREPAMAEDAFLDEFGQGGGSCDKFYWRLLHYYYSGDGEAKGYEVNDFCYF